MQGSKTKKPLKNQWFWCEDRRIRTLGTVPHTLV